MKKKTVYLLLIAITLITSCKKTETVPEELPGKITVTTAIYFANSQAIIGAPKMYWIKIFTTYPIGSRTYLHASFNNPYYSGSGKVSVKVPMPVFAKDTSVETIQPYSSGTSPSNYKIDSITGWSNFTLEY